MKRSAAAVVLAALIFGPAALAQDFPEFTNYVVDEAGVIDDSDEQSLNGALGAYQRQSGNQVAVAVLESLPTDNLEDYSNDLFEEWGIGDEDADNGVLLLIAMAERRIRIEVGYGLEGDMTDLESGRIIRDVIAPHMREGDVGAAVNAGVNAIAQAIGGEPIPGVPMEEPPAIDQPGGGSGFGSLFWLIPFMIFGPLSALGRRGRSGHGGRGRGGLANALLWGAALGSLGGRGGGGGFGGGGGGGFGGGGGGGSGGGGASGGW